ncbi:MAG TPA: prolyl oligopeptidase family serine peptidase, partial [Candidatus Krumholzibacteria bacterium]|nr:prolyl oligopeptidase family serine peptidase [Candidatus Krumholzibacteria bacterium]
MAIAPWGDARSQSGDYPRTRRDRTVETIHGVTIADPYRWLESLDNPETKAWVKSQSDLTELYLAHQPQREVIRDRLGALWSQAHTEVPWREAGRIFFLERSGDDPQPALYVLDEAGGTPRKLLDPRQLSPDGSIAIGDYAVSPDGRWISYAQSRGGGNDGETHVLSLLTGQAHRDVVRGTWSSACWTFDGGGFFYMRPPAPVAGAKKEAAGMRKQLRYHALGTAQSDDLLLHEWSEARWLYTVMSDDGRYAIPVMEQGPSAWMHCIDLRDALTPNLTSPLVPLLAESEGQHTPMGTVGDTLYVFTEWDAPRGRVVALDLREGARARPWTVVPQSSDVIQWATVAGNRLAIHYLADVKSRLSLFTLGGELAGHVELPGLGAIGWPVNGRNSSPEVWYSFESFLSPATVYRYDLTTNTAEPFRPPHVPFDASVYETKQVFYPSQDGTQVPIFVTGRKGIQLDGSHPVMLMSYGANGIVTAPSYRPDLPLWLELGGLYAVANIRGGGEYGEEWRRAGNRENKQTSLDDFIAAAEYLIAQGYTSREKLAVYGHSSGGLLIGAVMTQRPDLFAVALPSAGHHDMLRYHKFTIGAGWIPEYGSPDDPAEFRTLLAYSPLHHVRSGVCYPATMLLVADHDFTVVPSHSYKFAAALQADQSCERPVLLHVSRDASHGYASRDA